MTTQDLKACGRYRNEIESLEERIARLRSQAERLSKPLSLAPGGGEARDFLPEYMAKLDALERVLQRKEVAYQEHLSRVEAWLTTLPEQQAKVMRLRYVEGLRWKEVAKRVEYSEAHCKTIHSVAVKKVNTQ